MNKKPIFQALSQDQYRLHTEHSQQSNSQVSLIPDNEYQFNQLKQNQYNSNPQVEEKKIPFDLSSILKQMSQRQIQQLLSDPEVAKILQHQQNIMQEKKQVVQQSQEYNLKTDHSENFVKPKQPVHVVYLTTGVGQGELNLDNMQARTDPSSEEDGNLALQPLEGEVMDSKMANFIGIHMLSGIELVGDKLHDESEQYYKYDQGPYQDPETGCHFEFNDLVKRLKQLQRRRQIIDRAIEEEDRNCRRNNERVYRQNLTDCDEQPNKAAPVIIGKDKFKPKDVKGISDSVKKILPLYFKSHQENQQKMQADTESEKPNVRIPKPTLINGQKNILIKPQQVKEQGSQRKSMPATHQRQFSHESAFIGNSFDMKKMKNQVEMYYTQDQRPVQKNQYDNNTQHKRQLSGGVASGRLKQKSSREGSQGTQQAKPQNQQLLQSLFKLLRPVFANAQKPKEEQRKRLVQNTFDNRAERQISSVSKSTDKKLTVKRGDTQLSPTNQRKILLKSQLKPPKQQIKINASHRKSSSHHYASNPVTSSFDNNSTVPRLGADSVVQLQQPTQLDADKIANYIERLNIGSFQINQVKKQIPSAKFVKRAGSTKQSIKKKI